MLKTFIIGILLGVVAAIAAVYFVPAVDQYRESSIISVAPNGGNTEAFHVKVPMDRILIGAPRQSNPLPPELRWPDDAYLDGFHAELFKIRNARDAVVGVASRLAASDEEFGDSIEWVLHLPARGSMYVLMQPEAEGGNSSAAARAGELRSGTREFRPLRGRFTERWVADTSGDEDAPAGRIELLAQYVTAVAEDESQ